MRKAGILLHVSSLPNPYGIGTLGKEAYRWIDFLKKGGQTYWQMLPINPTSYGDSPYQSPSVFAGNPYLISMEDLVERGFLTEADLKSLEGQDPKRVDYGRLFSTKMPLLEKAYFNHHLEEEAFRTFVAENQFWLEDYALFMALKKEHDHKPFIEWYDDFKFKVPHAIDWFKQQYGLLIDQYRFMQYLFYSQFIRLKEYAHRKKIKLIGDMPIYCAYDSCDVWSHPEYFEVDDCYRQIHVAGCPPDAFTEDGQLWGNPLYRYDVMKKDGYTWWIERINQMGKLFDVVRIDHFRGFAGYYSIQAGSSNAKNGQWIEGPGYDLFKAVKKASNVDIIAENLGFLTPDVEKLLRQCGYPGMHIFQFELGDGKKVPLKKGFKENNVIYSGTHDNQTIMSFYKGLDEKTKKLVDTLCHITFTDRPNLKIIETCMQQACKDCIIPLQDYLGLTDEEGRMNIPSVASRNWSYRALESDFSKELAAYLKQITTQYERI